MNQSQLWSVRESEECYANNDRILREATVLRQVISTTLGSAHDVNNNTSQKTDLERRYNGTRQQL